MRPFVTSCYTAAHSLNLYYARDVPLWPVLETNIRFWNYLKEVWKGMRTLWNRFSRYHRHHCSFNHDARPTRSDFTTQDNNKMSANTESKGLQMLRFGKVRQIFSSWNFRTLSETCLWLQWCYSIVGRLATQCWFCEIKIPVNKARCKMADYSMQTKLLTTEIPYIWVWGEQHISVALSCF